MIGRKDCTSCLENISRSLSKRELAEKNEWKFLISQVRSCMLPYTPQIIEDTSFFRLPYLESDFMIVNLVRLNLAVLKISETSQEHTPGRVLC